MNGMHISRKRGLLVVAVFYCIALIQDVSATFTMTLETQSKECFVVRLPAAPTMVRYEQMRVFLFAIIKVLINIPSR